MAPKTAAEFLDLAQWKSVLTAFAKERDWEKFHTPKNLASALSVEASELLELFQWLTAEESLQLALPNGDAELRKNIEREMADVLVYLMRLSTVLKIDLSNATAGIYVVNVRTGQDSITKKFLIAK